MISVAAIATAAICALNQPPLPRSLHPFQHTEMVSICGTASFATKYRPTASCVCNTKDSTFHVSLSAENQINVTEQCEPYVPLLSCCSLSVSYRHHRHHHMQTTSNPLFFVRARNNAEIRISIFSLDEIFQSHP